MKKQLLNLQAFLLRLIYHEAGATETIVFTALLLLTSWLLLRVLAPGLSTK